MNFYKKILMIFLLLGLESSLWAADVSIDNNTGTLSGSSGGGTLGQSFQATKTGVLKSIAVADNGAGSGSCTLTIYDSADLTGTPLHTQVVGVMPDTVTDTSNYTYTTFTLDDTVNVTSGNSYSFDFLPADCSDLAYFGNTYADGIMYFNGGTQATLDMAFKIVQGDAASSAPTVTSVSSSTSNGSYKVGDVIAITVTFSEAVTVTGTPQLTLETGTTDRTVNYSSGSGTTALTFNYTVQSGDTSSDLDYVGTTSLVLNGGTINSTSSSTAATLTLASPAAANSLGANKSIVIDTTAPTVSSVTSTTANGSYKVGDTIAVTVTFSESVTVTGTPQLTLETGTTDRTVNYASGSGSSTLTFNYTVQSGDTTSDLDYISTSALALNSGTIKDSAGNSATLTLASPGAANSLGANKALVVDGNVPTVSSVTSTTANGTYKIGDTIAITVTFSESVTVTGTPQLTLETGTTDRATSYASGTGSSTLTFNYTVQSGDTTSDLDYISTSALALNSGTIKDSAGNSATLTLASPGAANSLGANKALVVDGTAPTISSVSPTDGNTSVGLNDNLVATFSENIAKGTGNIVIRQTSDDTAFETIAVTDAKVTVSGTTLTIDPAGTFSLNTGYYVQIASTAIEDSSGNTYAGISDTSTWNFTTVNNQSPTVSGTSSGQATNDNSGAMTPFSSVTLADNEGENVSVTLSLDDNSKGTLSSSSISSGTAATVQSTLRAITFTPTENRVAPGSSETTTITIAVSDGTSTTTDTTTTVVSTSINDNSTDISIDSSSVTYSAGTNAVVGALSTTDVDTGESYTYTLVNANTSASGTCSSDSNNSSFGISTTNLTVNDPSGMSGDYNICVQSNDGSSTFQKSLTINVVGNVAPTITNMSIPDNNTSAAVSSSGIITKIYAYKNYDDIVLTITANDDNNDTITYSSTYGDSSIFTTKSWSSNVLTLGSDTNTTGSSDINITVSDGTDSTYKSLSFKILSFNDINSSKDINVSTDSNGYTVTSVDSSDGNTIVKTKEKTGSTEHSIQVDGTTTKATSSLSGTTVEMTSDGVTTSYSSGGVSIEVNATTLGKATHSLSKSGKTTTATSEIVGATTTISTGSGGEPQIVTSVSNIEVTAKSDGTAVHSVTNGSNTSTVTSSILGASTTITSGGSVETQAGNLSSGSDTIQAKIITDSSGKSTTKFIRVDGSGNETDIGTTLKSGSSFPSGNSIEIYESGSKIYIKSTATMDSNFEVE